MRRIEICIIVFSVGTTIFLRWLFNRPYKTEETMKKPKHRKPTVSKELKKAMFEMSKKSVTKALKREPNKN